MLVLEKNFSCIIVSLTIIFFPKLENKSQIKNKLSLIKD